MSPYGVLVHNSFVKVIKMHKKPDFSFLGNLENGLIGYKGSIGVTGTLPWVCW